MALTLPCRTNSRFEDYRRTGIRHNTKRQRPLESQTLVPNLLSVRLQGVGLTISGRQIVEGIDWQVPVGGRAAILGANGSGKTSLIRILTGYRYPTQGEVEILGETLGRTCLSELRRRIGLVEPTLGFATTGRATALEIVLSGFFGHWTVAFDKPSTDQVSEAKANLADVGLLTMRDRDFATLSTGEQRRVLVARALVTRPELLILDESTSGLDLLARETLLATVDQLSRQHSTMTVLVVTHHLEELLPSTSEILLLADGQRLTSGDPALVLTPTNLRKAFGVPIDVRREGQRWTWHVDPGQWTSLLHSTQRQPRDGNSTGAGRDRQTE